MIAVCEKWTKVAVALPPYEVMVVMEFFFLNKFALYYIWGGTFTSWDTKLCTNSGRRSIQTSDRSGSQFKPIWASSCAHLLLERGTWTTSTRKKFMDIRNFASLNNTPEAENHKSGTVEHQPRLLNRSPKWSGPNHDPLLHTRLQGMPVMLQGIPGTQHLTHHAPHWFYLHQPAQYPLCDPSQ